MHALQGRLGKVFGHRPTQNTHVCTHVYTHVCIQLYTHVCMYGLCTCLYTCPGKTPGKTVGKDQAKMMTRTKFLNTAGECKVKPLPAPTACRMYE